MKSIYKYILILAISILNTKSIYAQAEIKKIIINDILKTIEIYPCIFFDSTFINIKSRDSISFQPIRKIENDTSLVRIYNIDSNNGYYFIQARISLLPSNILILSKIDTLNFTLYKSKGQFKRINGFFINEILDFKFGDQLDYYDLKKNSKIKVDHRFKINYKHKNISVIQEYLDVSLLLNISYLYPNLNTKPYIFRNFCREW